MCIYIYLYVCICISAPSVQLIINMMEVQEDRVNSNTVSVTCLAQPRKSIADIILSPARITVEQRVSTIYILKSVKYSI